MHTVTPAPQEGEAKRCYALSFRPTSFLNQAFGVPIGSAMGDTEYDLSCIAALVAVRQLVSLAPYLKSPIRSGICYNSQRLLILF